MDYTKDDIEVIPPERSQGYLADQHLDTLEQFLESRFRLPGTEYRFGFDALIGLIPGIGDVFLGRAFECVDRRCVEARGPQAGFGDDGRQCRP